MTSQATPNSPFQPLSPAAALNSLYSSLSLRLNYLNNNDQQKPYLVYVTKFQKLAEPMATLVADFLVNPVLRQAQRISGTGDHDYDNDDGADAAPHPFAMPPDAVQGFAADDTAVVDGGAMLMQPSGRPQPDSLDPAHSDLQRNADHRHLQQGPSPLASREVLPASPTADTLDFSPSRIELPIREIPMAASLRSDSEHVTTITPDALDVEQQPSSGASSPNRGRVPSPLPEDDGMGPLRKRILSIQAQELPAQEKAQLMHRLFTENYAKSQTISSGRAELSRPEVDRSRPATPSDASSWQHRIAQKPLESLKFWQKNVLGDSAPTEQFILTEEDIRPTFVPPTPEEEVCGHDLDDRPLGCQHYMRNVKLQCSTCARWYTCRFCHDEVEDHELIRKDTKNMLCMYCGTAQKAGEACAACGVSAARYYCGVCKLWNNDPDKHVYHCEDCGICRIGRGLGKDFFHCKRCCACIAINTAPDHKCIERATDCDCPICGDYMFTSPKPVVFMKCGHSIHGDCFQNHMETSYKCPICNKSVVNMEIQFRNLDLAIQAQPMPPELQDTQAVVLCNDCSAKSSVQYHWLGLKCGVCDSYNTAQLQILGANPPTVDAPAVAPTPASEAVSQNTTAEVSNPREIFRRRRHSSNYMGPGSNDIEAGLQIQSRLARSESPLAASERPLRNMPTAMETEDDDDEDILGFWSRVPRSIPSDDEADDNETEYSGDESDSNSEDEDELEDEDDEDDENDSGLVFFMPGHR